MGESDGKAVSSTAAKQELGRTSFRRPKGSHEGHLARTTEYAASLHLSKRGPKKSLTATEKTLLREANPSRVDDLLRAGYSYEDISELLDW